MKIDRKGFSSVTELKNYIKPSRIFKVGILSTLSCLCISACNVGTSGSNPTNGLSTTNSNVVSKVKSDKISKSASQDNSVMRFAPGFTYGTTSGIVFRDGAPLPKDPVGTAIPGQSNQITSLTVVANTLFATTAKKVWTVDLRAATTASNWKDTGLYGPHSPVVANNGGIFLIQEKYLNGGLLFGSSCLLTYTYNLADNDWRNDMSMQIDPCDHDLYAFGLGYNTALIGTNDNDIWGVNLIDGRSWTEGNGQKLPVFPTAMYTPPNQPGAPLYTISGRDIYTSSTWAYQGWQRIDTAPSAICEGVDTGRTGNMQSNVIGQYDASSVYVCTEDGVVIEGSGSRIAYYQAPAGFKISMLAATSDGNLYAVSKTSNEIKQYSPKTGAWTDLQNQVPQNGEQAFGDITAITAVDNLLIIGTVHGYALMSVPSVQSKWWSPTSTYPLEGTQPITQMVTNNALPDDITNTPLTYALLSNNHVYYKVDNLDFSSWTQVHEQVVPSGTITQIEADRFNLYALTSNYQILWADIYGAADAWFDCSSKDANFKPSQIMPIDYPRYNPNTPSNRPYLFAIVDSTSGGYFNTDIYSTNSCTAPDWIDRGTPPDTTNSQITALSKSYDNSLIYAATANPFINTIFSADPSPENATSYPLVWDSVESFDTAGNTLGPIVSFQVPSIVRDNNNGPVGAFEWKDNVPGTLIVNTTKNAAGKYEATVHLRGVALVNGREMVVSFNVASGQPIPGVYDSIDEAQNAVSLMSVHWIDPLGQVMRGYIVLVRATYGGAADVHTYQASTTEAGRPYQLMTTADVLGLPLISLDAPFVPARRPLCRNPGGACGSSS